LETAAREFLIRLLETPSPSGYEQPIQKIVRDYLGGVADTIHTDAHGNVIGAKNAGAPTRMLLAGHCDQIGLIVQYIDSEGYISVQPIGGWDPMQLVGSRVVIWTASGAVPGVIARKPIHLLTDEERKVVPKMKDLWIDIGAPDKADAESVVRVGDCVTFELKVQALQFTRERIARNRVVDHLRRQRSARVAPATGGDPDASSAWLDVVVDDDAPRPDAAVVRDEDEARRRQAMAEILRAFVGELWEAGEFDKLMVLEFLFVLGGRNKDAAERFGIADEKHVAGIKFRAVERLRGMARQRDPNHSLFRGLWGPGAR
jgi:hypothetical protein